MKAVAIELDVLGDTRPLWDDWLADAARRFRSISPLDPAALPADRVVNGRPCKPLGMGIERSERTVGTTSVKDTGAGTLSPAPPEPGRLTRSGTRIASR